MQITSFKIQYLPSTILVVVGVLVLVLSLASVATAGTYAESAHGNTTYGVNRSNVVEDPDHPDAYDIGACAHCHDTFNDSICGVNPLMLFKTQYFCVQCHQDPDSSDQAGMPVQGCYGYKFGGDTTITCPLNVMSAFLFIDQTSGSGQPRWNCSTNKGSAHHLADIGVFLQNRWGFGDTSDDINLCEGCHNPHKAQRHNYPVGSKGTSPISRPSTHNIDWDVYGADASERMDSYASPYTYEAPRYYYSAGGYEPDGGIQQNGANMPDYVTFCTDCHNSSNDIWSTQLGRYLHKFDWVTEKHGRGAASDASDYDDFLFYGSPYRDSQAGSYVMSCLDCHEPHGSSNSYLARATVNGAAADLTRGDVNPWGDWCGRCHDDISHYPGPHTSLYNQGSCTPCHPVIVDPPGVGDTCDCHYHGAGPGVGGL